MATKRPLADAHREVVAAGLRSEGFSPEEWAARYAHRVGCFSLDECRYADAVECKLGPEGQTVIALVIGEKTATKSRVGCTRQLAVIGVTAGRRGAKTRFVRQTASTARTHTTSDQWP